MEESGLPQCGSEFALDVVTWIAGWMDMRYMVKMSCGWQNMRCRNRTNKTVKKQKGFSPALLQQNAYPRSTMCNGELNLETLEHGVVTTWGNGEEKVQGTKGACA